MKSLDRVRLVSFYLFVFLASVYILSLSYSFTSRNSGEGFMRIHELEYLLQTGDIGWPSFTGRWGSPGRDGKLYNWHQFGQSLLALPIYLYTRGTSIAFFALNIIATALVAVMLMNMLLVQGVRLRSSLLVGLTFGLCTLSWYYASKTPHEHALANAGAFGAVYFAFLYQNSGRRWNLMASAICMGIGFIVRYDVLLTLLPIAAYLHMGRNEGPGERLRLPWTVAIYIACLVPFALFNMGYNYVRFESLFQTGYAGSTGGISRMFGPEYLPRGLIGILLSPGRSIFLFSPPILLFFFYIRAYARRVGRAFATLQVSYILMYLLFYSLHHSWDGDWCFGPRYYLGIIPFMLMPLGVMFDSFGTYSILRRGAIAGLLALSLYAQVAFVSTDATISGMMKFGVDDDAQPYLTEQYRRSFGEHGSWEWLASYFPLEYSQFLNTLKIFHYTIEMQMDNQSIIRIREEIEASQAPYINYYMPLFMDFDFWWRPYQRGMSSANAALVALALAVLSLAEALRLSGAAGGVKPHPSPEI